MPVTYYEWQIFSHDTTYRKIQLNINCAEFLVPTSKLDFTF